MAGVRFFSSFGAQTGLCGKFSLLWLSILAPIVLLASISKTASLLLLPYLVWVSFAAVLNLAIVRLNGPFGV